MRRALKAILIVAALLALSILLGLLFADLMMAQHGNLYP
jgi:hypothetical protein